MGAKKTISYRYDSVGNRVGMTDPDGGRFTYTYDNVNRITQVINPQGERTSYAYDDGGRRTVKKLANGTRASFSYDDASNLRRLANLKSDGTTISSFDYDYDNVGNRTAVVEADGSRVTWSYDDTDQLTGEHRTGSHAYRNTYTYDPAGNRLLKVHDGALTTYSYDAANQLKWSEDASGRTTYRFDADGNQELVLEPTGDRTTTTWDHENRTTLVQLPSGIRNTMAYEPDGLRVKLQETTGTKKFVWDKQNYLAETDGNDDTQVVYTNEPRVYGNLVSQRRGMDSHWYHFDATGSTRALTDPTEAVVGTALYDAWGRSVSWTGLTAVLFRYTGRRGYYVDLDTRAYYVRARIYIPKDARWKSADPLGLAGSLNRFVYVDNGPIVCVDPSGQISCEKAYSRNNDDVGTGQHETAEVLTALHVDTSHCAITNPGCAEECEGVVRVDFDFVAKAAVTIYCNAPIIPGFPNLVPLSFAPDAIGFFEYGRSARPRLQLESNSSISAPLDYNFSGHPCGLGDTLSGSLPISRPGLNEVACKGGSIEDAVLVIGTVGQPGRPRRDLVSVRIPFEVTIEYCGEATINLFDIAHVAPPDVPGRTFRRDGMYNLIEMAGSCPEAALQDRFPPRPGALDCPDGCVPTR